MHFGVEENIEQLAELFFDAVVVLYIKLLEEGLVADISQPVAQTHVQLVAVAHQRQNLRHQHRISGQRHVLDDENITTACRLTGLSAMGVFSGSRSVREFHSYEGAPNYWNHKYAEEDISIHAPAKERPQPTVEEIVSISISIHAPVRERPDVTVVTDSPYKFQSTLPRGND